MIEEIFQKEIRKRKGEMKMSFNFYQTRGGQQFIDRTMPSILKALEKQNRLTEESNAQRETIIEQNKQMIEQQAQLIELYQAMLNR